MVNRRSGKGPAISVSGAVSYHENGIIKDADGIHIGQWKEASKTPKVSHFQLRSSSFLCVALLPDFCCHRKLSIVLCPHFLTFDRYRVKSEKWKIALHFVAIWAS